MESFILGSLIKETNFLLLLSKMPDKSSNVPSSIVYFAIGAELLEQVTTLNHSSQQFSHFLPVWLDSGY